MAKKKFNPLKFIFKLRFQDFLAIVSILGFLTIFISSIARNIDIGPWVDGFLFILIGTALMVSGGIQFLFKMFEGGLSNREITKLLTILVGIASFIVGIFTFPIQAFASLQTVPIVGGIKTIISALAIIIIIADSWISKSLVK